MSNSVETVQADLHGKLNQVEDRLVALRVVVEEVAHHPDAEIRAKLEQARVRVRQQKFRALRAIARLKSRAVEKSAESVQSAEWWNGNHRTARAERYASDAIELAAAAINVAEEAILDAVVANLDAVFVGAMI